MRVFQGVTGQAGQPSALAAGLRERGVDAEAWTIADHKFGYNYDKFIEPAAYESPLAFNRKLIPLLNEFDVFHFHARSFFANWPHMHYPAGIDLLLLKMLGKRVFFHFRGQEIRLAAEFSHKNPFHYVGEASGHLFTKMPDTTKVRFRDLVTSICDGVFVTDPELQSYVPGSIVVPRVLEGRDWPYVGPTDKKVPLVVHAPSRRGVKGTSAVIKAAEELQKEGIVFQLKLVENVSHAEAVDVYREADVIVDQLRIGWYGVLGCEGMALGKPVIAYIRDDLWEEHQETLPIVNADPLTIKDKLRTLILSRDLRQKVGFQSREYFLRNHDVASVVPRLLDIYRQRDRTPELSGYIRFLDHQREVNEAPMSNLRHSRRFHLLWATARADGPVAAINLVANFLRKYLK